MSLITKNFLVEHEEGDIIYLKTDIDQKPRMVIGYKVRGEKIIYLVTCGITESDHYAMEMSSKKNILLSLDIDTNNPNNKSEDHE